MRAHRRSRAGSRGKEAPRQGAGPPGKRTRTQELSRRRGRDDRPEGVTVRYVSSQDDFVTKLARLLRVGEAEPADDLPGMVESIIESAGGEPIRTLYIEGHGSEGYQAVANQAGIYDRPEVLQQLTPLRNHFAPGAEVVLLGCNVGGGPHGEELLLKLATIWGVSVRATTAYNRPLIPGFEGGEATATADGEIERTGSSIDGFARGGPPGVDDEQRHRLETQDPEKLSMGYRFKALNRLLGGYRSAEDRAWILTLFETATPDERRQLYAYLEHHEWTGDFRKGLFVADDSLWNALSSEEAEELKELLNE